MEYLKRAFILIIGLAMIAGVIYIIYVSQQAQKQRLQPQTEWTYPTPAPDTSHYAPAPADTGAVAPESLATAPPQTSPDSIHWNALPRPRQLFPGRPIPPGNPNPIFIRAAQRILPAVVTIQSSIVYSSVPRDKNHKFFWDQHGGDDKDKFYGEGSGSGILISDRGYLLTNYHVIENGSDYKVTLYDKREFPARYIGGDPTTDIAVLKIDGTDLPSAYLGNSDSVHIGEWVLAVGSPLNFTSTITAGIISALGRDIRIINERYGVENFIQTDAVINPGNSGGALVNLKGEVIGINTAIATRTGLYQGYGFAIPSNLAKKVVNDLLKYGYVKRALIGVTISAVDNTVARGVGLPRPMGVLVQGIEPGYPAADAGLKPGDVILSVDGENVVSVNDLQIKIAQKHPGDRVRLGLWRDKKEMTLTVKLAQAPTGKPRVRQQSQNHNHYQNLGMQIRDLTGEEKKTFQTDHGIFIEKIKPMSPANTSNILPGDVLVAVNDKPVANVKDFEETLAQFKEGDVIKLTLLQRGLRGIDQRITFVEVK